MPRLIAFGCSFTVGQGLPDVYPVIKPSSYAWPNVLGDRLGYEVVNNGIAGAGNSEIAANIFRTDFKEDDLCVILWSHFTRYDYFVYGDDLTGKNEWGRNEYIHMLSKDPIEESWWKEHNRVKNWLTINHAGLYLESKNIRFLQMLGVVDDSTYPKVDLSFPNLVEDCMPHDFIIDRAMDAEEAPPGHPGTGSQRLIANLFYDRIKT
jgi:hypothetical protein